MLDKLVLSLFVFLPTFGGNIDISQDYKLLESKQISLENRQPVEYINSVYRDNILLTLSYMSGKVTGKENVDWNDIRQPDTYTFRLLPDETFAFHEDVFPEYEESLKKTTNANFNYDDGFKSDGYLMGNGVCHFASLIYWAASGAGLKTYVPTKHDFAVIPDISGEYGVSIYKMPGLVTANARQNLYITNNKDNPIVFEFEYDGKNIKLSVFEENI